MKKLLMIAIMALTSMTMSAQAGSTWIGANVNYGLHSDYKNFGIGAKVQWEFIDNVRLDMSGNYFFKKDYLTQWDANLNLHYLIPIGVAKIYPLAGLTILGSKVEGFDGDDDFGVNLGGGVEFPLSETVKLNFEAKYQIVDHWDRPVISAGIAFAL